ncbi:MAG: radical SAM protein [Promethearchaeota archaeon]
MVVVNLLVNNYCNLECPHCYVDSVKIGSNKALMKQISLMDVERLTKATSKMGVEFFHLFGGEPFLHPQIHDICEIIKEKSIPVNIATNGLFIEKNLDWLDPEYISLSVNILDDHALINACNFRYPLDEVKYGARVAVDCGIDVSGIVCVFPVKKTVRENALYFFEYMSKINEQVGIKNFFLLYFSRLGRGKVLWQKINNVFYRPDNWLLFLRLIRNMLKENKVSFNVFVEPAFEASVLDHDVIPESLQCEMVIHENLVVDHDLNVYPCVLMLPMKDNPFKTKFQDNVRNVYTNYKNLQDNCIIDLAQECRSCDQLPYCCPCIPYMQDGKKDYRCSSKNKKGTLMGCPLITIKL